MVASDFAEDAEGRFDGNETGLVILDRASGIVTTRRLPGKPSFPSLDWAAIHPEPKLQAHAMKSGPVATDPGADRTIATTQR